MRLSTLLNGWRHSDRGRVAVSNETLDVMYQQALALEDAATQVADALDQERGPLTDSSTTVTLSAGWLNGLSVVLRRAVEQELPRRG